MYKIQHLEYILLFHYFIPYQSIPSSPVQFIYMWLLNSIKWRYLQHCILYILCLQAYDWLYNETLPQRNKLYYRIRHKLNQVPICTIDHV